jgi:hypothetical protein
MTANEMAYEFDLRYDKAATLASAGLDDAEIGTFLSIAQESLVKSRYERFGNKYLKGFEGNEKRRKELAELVKAVTLTNSNLSSDQTNTYPNGFFFDIPEEVMFVITERLEITKKDCKTNSNKIIPIIPITHDEVAMNLDNPFKKPDASEAWRLDFSSGVNRRHEIIIGEGYSIVNYPIRYIKKPVDIVVDRITPANQINSVLDESIHREIVAEAVRLASSATQQVDYQIKDAESMKTE